MKIPGLSRQQAQLAAFLWAGWTRAEFADYFCLSDNHVNQVCYYLRKKGFTVPKPRMGPRSGVSRRQQVVAVYESLSHLPKWGRANLVAQRLNISPWTVNVHIHNHRKAKRAAP